jgi:Uma2 family endonuclease
MAHETLTSSEEPIEGAGLMTAEDLARLPDDGWKYQLVEGRLLRMPPTGGDHDTIAARLIISLGAFVQTHNLGEMTLSQSGYLVNLPDEPEKLLVPDLAFVRAARVPKRGTAEAKGFWRLAPDLVVEVVSPSQSQSEMEKTARRWLKAGTRLVWIIWPDPQQVDVWRPDAEKPATTLGINDALDGLDVLPGFSCPVARLFR